MLFPDLFSLSRPCPLGIDLQDITERDEASWQRRIDTPDLKQMITEGFLEEARNRLVEQLARNENELLVELFRLRAQQAV